MTGDSFSRSFKALLLAILSLASAQAPDASGRSVTPPAEGSMGGLQAILNNTMSPAFGATIIIIITVIVSGSAYLCFLKYICVGCCRGTLVEPAFHLDPNKSEEQV